MDLTTRGGQEFAAAIKSISRSLRDNEDDKVGQRAWELFKQEVDKAELMPPYKNTLPLNYEQLRYYAKASFEIAKAFTEVEQGR